nr:unnamed protein product [Callosobruchus chinensis]
MVIFFRLLDISGVNAHVLYQCFKDNSNIEKADFFKILADHLVKPHLHRRAESTRIKRELRTTIRKILSLPDHGEQDTLEEKLQKRKTCHTCPPKIKRKTFYLCRMCHKPTCLVCRKNLQKLYTQSLISLLPVLFYFL